MALIQLPANTFDPPTILAQDPCLNCWSIRQLKALEMYLWAVRAGYSLPRQLDTLQTLSACWKDPCVSERKRFIARITKNLEELIDSELVTSLADIQEDLKCIDCLKPDTVDAAMTYAFMKHFDTVL